MAEDGLAARYRTRYQPLIDHLAARDGRDVVLTLPEIEAIIGAPLATTAYVDTWYWTGRTLACVRRWEALGWRARLDRRNGRVHFARDGGD